jgi:hypothetical protein
MIIADMHHQAQACSTSTAVPSQPSPLQCFAPFTSCLLQQQQYQQQ